MTFIVFTPIIQLIGFVCFMIPLILYSIYLASDGIFRNQYLTINNQPILIGKVYELSSNIQQKLWFFIFCLLWTINFIIAIGVMVIAVACSSWYFTPSHERKIKYGSSHIFISYYIVLRYHLGSLAFGSLIIAFIAVSLFYQYFINKSFFFASFQNILQCI